MELLSDLHILGHNQPILVLLFGIQLEILY
jgi:hypothetical protein